MDLPEEHADELRDHHRQLLAHLGIVRDRDDKVSYDDAMWLMMRAAEYAIESRPVSEEELLAQLHQ